jgi:hypothetical protein
LASISPRFDRLSPFALTAVAVPVIGVTSEVEGLNVDPPGVSVEGTDVDVFGVLVSVIAESDSWVGVELVTEDMLFVW